MKHFRSLLSLGAIEDDEHIEPFELRRIRSHLPKSTRLSQRKRPSKQRLESTNYRPSFGVIEGKRVPALSHSISTKLRRQFFYPNRRKKKDIDRDRGANENNIIINTQQLQEEETREIYLQDEWDGYNDVSMNEIYDADIDTDFDLQLPTGMDTFYAFQSPNATPKIHENNNNNNHMMMAHAMMMSSTQLQRKKSLKPRLNSELPSPRYHPLQYHTIMAHDSNKTAKLQLNKLLPPPPPPPPIMIMKERHNNFKLIPMMNSNSLSYNNTPASAAAVPYLPFHPENSITSIKSESVTKTPMTQQRTSLNSWPSVLNLNNCVSSKSTQIRATEYNQQLSPIYDDEMSYRNNGNNPWKESPHLTQLADTVQALTDDDDDEENEEELEIKEELESEIENEIADTNSEDEEYRPRLATIVSQASSVNASDIVRMDPLTMINYNIQNTYSNSNSFPSSQRTSRTINSSTTFDEDADADVNVAFEYIPDEQETAAVTMDARPDDDDEIERVYTSQGMDVLMQRDFPWYDFEFMDNIGRGAYGVVDKSFHLKSCQIVAMKRSRSLKKRMMDSFKREVLICAEFAECPYIINMIECGIDESKNEICCALEYMNCASLTSRKRYTLHEIRTICFCVLSALCALHSKLYVHNDIKPDNILFNSAFDVKLTDFGCCQRMRDMQTPLTQPNGSLIYQSYEKKFVSPIQYTTQSDIYSFGITIAEILNATHTQSGLQHGVNGVKIPYKLPSYQNNNNENENDVSPAPPPQCIDFLRKCLMRDYHERWTARQLLSHPFICSDGIIPQSISAVPQFTSMTYDDEDLDSAEDDLEFITQTLINYYLNYNNNRNVNARARLNNENLNNFFRDLSKTPIDDEYTDTKRIENIAKCTGYSVEAVHDFIFRRVNGVKNKYLKR